MKNLIFILSRIRVILILILILILIQFSHSFAEKYKYQQKANNEQRKTNNEKRNMAQGCTPATGKSELNINNVRARINTGGDMWWDLQGNAKYEIPKGSGKTAMFSAALWIAGIDINGQLKCAAQRYRQNGVDYWTGPLTTDGSASISDTLCHRFDKFFPVTRGEVEQFKAWIASGKKLPKDYTPPDDIVNWQYCANGNGANQCFYLAPYFSANGSGGPYNWENGDYPYYDFDNTLCKKNTPTPGCTEGDLYGGRGILADQVLKGDQTLWWVFNDKGNIHTESGGAAIGMEIRAQAFAFTTNDEINNMTFYSYELINRSTFRLNETYFSQWVDSDIGYAFDDYVGCDVRRGLGYTYNGKDIDGSGQPWAYGEHPPAAGVDFFQGPYMDPVGFDRPAFDPAHPYAHCDESINGVNFGDLIPDNERFGMRRFVYHNNSSDVMGDPETAIQYYNYLRGIWKDNTKMKYGGNAHYGAGAYGPDCDFMFPDLTDPCNWGTGGKTPNGPVDWTEESANNQPYDRRFMESAGPFTLEPGAVNYITVGVPWARSLIGGPWQSVELLRTVDDKCQHLFDNCFKVLDGPDAPDMVIQEMDKELVLYITNSKLSNNYNERYEEYDPEIVTPETFSKEGLHFDSIYRFEGYQIYQLASASVSVADLQNPDLARLVAQCDIKNFRKTITFTVSIVNNKPDTTWHYVDNQNDPIGDLVNYILDENTGGNVPVKEVTGANTGITHTFDIKLDQFATGDKRLVNNKQYYFMAIAYAYNEFMKYSDDQTSQINPRIYKGYPEEGSGLLGQKKPYLGGRKAAGGQPISYTVGIPHFNNPEFTGVFSNAKYGDGPKISRIEGQGNGSNVIELTDSTIQKVLSSQFSVLSSITYRNGKGPINVKIIDPLTVEKADYILKFYQRDTIVNSFINPVSSPSIHWILINKTSGKADTSDRTISDRTFTRIGNEQVFLDYGFSITIQQAKDPGDNSSADQNGYLSPSANDKTFKEVEYADSSHQWLGGVPNQDINSPWHWIRSGTLVESVPTGDPPSVNNSYDYIGVGQGTGLDDGQFFERFDGGMWAPYRMCSKYVSDPSTPTVGYGPAWNNGTVMGSALSKNSNKLANLASVDLVITPDPTKWSRSAVIELSDDKVLTEDHNTVKFNLRTHNSLNKDTNSYDPNSTGYGWFPGYAINVETGERLNIVYGENSWLVGEHGADMKFNPTSNYTTPLGDILWGGMHYVYIFGHNGNTSSDVPAYDECTFIHDNLATGNTTNKISVWKDAMWAGIPMAVAGQKWLSNKVTIRFRVTKPYRRYYSASGTGAQNPQNNDYPIYSFTTKDLFTEKNDIPVAKNALDLINVVPNPYYSWAAYETNQLDTRVRITNLPIKCTITIYTLSGGIVRQFKIDHSGLSSLKTVNDSGTPAAPVAVTSQDWDLNNQAGIPVSSGLYLIYVKAPGLGEKVVKWFGTIRPQDVNAL